MKTLTLVSILYLLALGGCATSSGIALNTQGDKSLTVSASPVKGGVAAAQRLAREEATASCKDGGQMQIIAEVLHSPSLIDQLVVTGMSTSTLTFRCVAAESMLERMLRAAPATCADMNPEARVALRCKP